MIKNSFKILIAFFLLPLVWQYATKYEWMLKLETLTLKFRYFIRGNIDESQLKKPLPPIFLVNLDQKTLEYLGEEPIPVSNYAKAIYALTMLGKSRTLASNVVFNEKQYSSLVDRSRLAIDEKVCHQFLSSSQNFILGAWFGNLGDINKVYLKNTNPYPLIYKGFEDFDKNQNPLRPSNRMVGENINLGILNGDDNMNTGGAFRWIPLFARTKDNIYYSLSLAALISYEGIAPEHVIVYGDDSNQERYEGKHKIVLLNDDEQVLFQIPMEKRQLLEINWFGDWDSANYKKISLIDVLKNYDILADSNSNEVAKSAAEKFFEQFNDSVIFFGNSFNKGENLIHSPIDIDWVPNICSHVNAFKTMYSGCYLERLLWWKELLIVFLLNAFVACIVLYSEFFGRWGKGFIALIILYFISTCLVFGRVDPNCHFVLPIVAPLGCLFSFLLFGLLYQVTVERKQRLRIKNIFGNYLSPAIVTAMTEQQNDPQLGGVEKNITAFFSDIQNFSTFSELLEPTALVRLMNEYLTAMTNIIQEEGGNLDKYIGDAIVAMFGAPFSLEMHPKHACMAACRIQEKQKVLREKWSREKGVWPSEILGMRTRVGLNSGVATVGNMGSETRFNFTMMGDTVNIAARCESGAKSYGVYSLVSEDTYKKVTEDTDLITFRFIDRIVVKGRRHPLGVYEIVGLKHDLDDSTFECMDLFEKATYKYLGQDWEAAIRLFEQAARLELLQPTRDAGIFTNPSLVFAERCRYMRNMPPNKDWNGVFVMKTK